jgi:hypothetical protein
MTLVTIGLPHWSVSNMRLCSIFQTMIPITLLCQEQVSLLREHQPKLGIS